VRRRIVLALTLVAVATAAAVGWVAGTRIKSPAQVAAEAEPPEPSLITVPVERMVISNDVITRGTVRFDAPEAVVANGVALDRVSPVVTWIPAVGDEIPEGTVLYELSGRPTFALQGDLPLFRTVLPGDEGEDIAQLQEALARLGFDPGAIDGIYGPGTEAALVAFYHDRGYEPIEPAAELLAAVDLAEDMVDQAQDVYDQAKEARAAVVTAASQANAAVATAQQALDAAEIILATAEDRLAQAEAGTHPDTGLPPTAGELAVLEGDVAVAEEAVADAAGTLS